MQCIAPLRSTAAIRHTVAYCAYGSCFGVNNAHVPTACIADRVILFLKGIGGRHRNAKSPAATGPKGSSRNNTYISSHASSDCFMLLTSKRPRRPNCGPVLALPRRRKSYFTPYSSRCCLVLSPACLEFFLFSFLNYAEKWW